MVNYVRVLLEASDKYGNDSGSFALFDSAKYGKKDPLFKDSTEKLVDVSGQSYLEFLGGDYIAVIKGLNECLTVDGGKGSIKPNFLVSGLRPWFWCCLELLNEKRCIYYWHNEKKTFL